jgi:tripartite-type tricarboxylate transporter receptor subunit TctC
MKKFSTAFVAAFAFMSWSTVWAWQPTRPITVVSPVAPGSGNEMSFRAVAAQLEKEGKARFVFDYKAGADGNIGMNHFVKQPSDGYTIAIPACQSTFVAADVHYTSMLQYHPMRDLTLVTNIAKSPLAFVANAGSRVNTVPELIAAVTRPDRDITFAVGGASHALAFEYFMDRVNGDNKRVKHVFYKGPVPALTDAAAGVTEFAVVPIAVANTLLSSGKVKIIGIAGEQKLSAFPNTALMKDHVPGLNVYACWNIVLPPNTPREIVKWYLDNFVPAIRSAESKRYFDENMMFIAPGSHTPEGLRRDMEQLRKQWQPYVAKMPSPLGTK